MNTSPRAAFRVVEPRLELAKLARAHHRARRRQVKTNTPDDPPLHPETQAIVVRPLGGVAHNLFHVS